MGIVNCDVTRAVRKWWEESIGIDHVLGLNGKNDARMIGGLMVALERQDCELEEIEVHVNRDRNWREAVNEGWTLVCYGRIGKESSRHKAVWIRKIR